MPKQQKKMSIRVKILRATLHQLILFAVIMGISSILLVNRLAKEDATHLMTQVCEKEKIRYDNKLNLVSHSLSIIYDYINETNTEQKFEVYSNEYENHIREFAVSVANQTEGALSIYYRYNPELVGTGTGGFFWSKLSDDVVFTEQTPTDILKYNVSDMEHVGWFYEPKEKKEPMWMKPYYNQNLGVFMISYIIPIYSAGNEFIGVVGMDIDFNSIMKSESDIVLYETGKIALADLSERLIYTNEENDNSYSEKLSINLYNHITTINKSREILEITEDDGSENVICCRRLTNGLVLFVDVPKNEIYANRNQLTVFTVCLTVFILFLTIVAIRKQTTQIVEPINQLAEVTGYYAMGDWSHKFTCCSGDEVQNLSESIEIMAKNTQDYLSTLNDLARTDGLTGLKNKTSYLECVNEIIQNRHCEYEEYALVVLDLNLLKKTNDNLGHEAGDALLKEAGKYICRTFRHSAVFRIGGDEFVAVLTQEDYLNRVRLCEMFEKGMNYEVNGIAGCILSISYGLASFPEDAADYDELFKIADDRMYAKKKEMKMRREDQV